MAWLSGAMMLALLWRLEDRAGRVVALLVMVPYAALALAAEPSIGRAMLLFVGLASMIGGHFGARTLRQVREPEHAIAIPPAQRALLRPGSESTLISRALVRPIAIAISVVTVFAFAAYLALPEPSGGLRRNVPGAGGGAFGQGSAGRSLATYSGGDLSLNARGKLPDVPVAEVAADSPQYWRMGVLDSYSGQRWVDSSSDAGGLWAASGGEKQYSVQPREGFTGAVLAPGAPTAINTAKLAWSGYRFAVRANAPYQVSVTAYPSVRESGAGIDGTDPRDDPSDPRWVELPAGSQRIAGLAATLPGDASDPAGAAIAIENYLHSAPFRYDLDAPLPQAGADPIDFFLFESRSGFCEHYAAAEALLLRAKGIPARVATGFAGGSDEGGARVIRGTNAHAWVEVYVEERGWVTSEPTPAAASSGFVLTDTLKRALAALLVVAVLVGAWLVSRGRRRRGGARPKTVRQDEISAAVVRLRAALELADHPSTPSTTLADLGNWVGEAPEVFALLERHAYAAGGISAEERLWLLTRLDELSARVRSRASSAELVGASKR